jgi:hypothetical protein
MASGDAVLSLLCLAIITVLAGPILLIVYYARGPLLSTTKADCVWWPEPSASTSTSGGTVNTDQQCTYRRVNITNLDPPSGRATDETWQLALVNNYILETSNTAAESSQKNLSEPFACYPFAPSGAYPDITRACSRASVICSEECVWDMELGYDPSTIGTMQRKANGEVIDYTTYANKRRIAVFMEPQEIEPVGIAVRNWGIGVTSFAVVMLVAYGYYEKTRVYD